MFFQLDWPGGFVCVAQAFTHDTHNYETGVGPNPRSDSPSNNLQVRDPAWRLARESDPGVRCFDSAFWLGHFPYCRVDETRCYCRTDVSSCFLVFFSLSLPSVLVWKKGFVPTVPW